MSTTFSFAIPFDIYSGLPYDPGERFRHPVQMRSGEYREAWVLVIKNHGQVQGSPHITQPIIYQMTVKFIEWADVVKASYNGHGIDPRVQLPKDKQAVLVSHCQRNEVFVCTFDKSDDYWWPVGDIGEDSYRTDEIECWCPLPTKEQFDKIREAINETSPHMQ